MSQLKNILLIFGVLLLFSCAKKKEEVRVPEDKIEIYLTKKELFKENCILLKNYKPFIDSLKTVFPKLEIEKDFFRILHLHQIDTISKIKSYKGNFHFFKSDLQKSPIVFDHEIISFNLKTSELEIDSIANNKLRKMIVIDNGQYGQQFVITYNEDIILKGYFINSFTSVYLNWHVIPVSYYEPPKDDKIISKKLKISNDWTYIDSIIPEITSKKAFIEALRETNRLIE